MTALDIFLRLVGFLYAFAGFCVAYSALREHLIDEALDGLFFSEPDPADKIREIVTLCLGTLVFAGGVTLVLLLDVAAWLFLAAAISMVLLLVWITPRYFGAMKPHELKRSIYAFVAYAVATALVLGAWYQERLLSWDQAPWPLLAIAAGVILAFCGYLVWTWVRLRKESLMNQ